MNTFEQMLKDMIGAEKTHKEPPTETKGFTSLVTAEEYEAIKELVKATENFINVHNKCAVKTVLGAKDQIETYARVQMLLLGDIVNDLQSAVGMMYGIHSCDKEFIDSLVAEGDFGSLEDLEKKLIMNKIMGDIFR